MHFAPAGGRFDVVDTGRGEPGPGSLESYRVSMVLSASGSFPISAYSCLTVPRPAQPCRAPPSHAVPSRAIDVDTEKYPGAGSA